jgi:MOSC domain-containing protein YiiM
MTQELESPQLQAICTGAVRPLFMRDPHDPHELHQTQSAIAKSPVSTLQTPEAVWCGKLGIRGDEQADPSVHGGPDKAVYCYPASHYAFWQREIPQLSARQIGDLFGQVGENLTITGLDERQIWIGDELQIGNDVILRVSKPREPCYKFNARMGSQQAAKMMVKNDLCGWYCSVIREGYLQAGDPIRVRAGPRDITVARENQLLATPRRP